MESIEHKNTEKLVDFLKSVCIFSTLERVKLNYIVKNCKEITYKKGDMICKKDDYAKNVYIIKSGAVTEFAMDDNEFSVMIKYSMKADYFGDLGVLVDNSYVTTVMASSQAVLIVIPGEIFSKLVWENPCVMKEMLRSYRKRLQNSAQKIMSCTMFNSEGRLAYILMMIYKESNKGIFVNETQENLSVRCGVSRQTVSTILNNWKRSEVVNVYRGKIEITNMEALTDILLNGAKS